MSHNPPRNYDNVGVQRQFIASTSLPPLPSPGSVCPVLATANSRELSTSRNFMCICVCECECSLWLSYRR